MGCYRTIEEIIKWINLSSEEKEAIIRKIKNRKNKALKSRTPVNAVWLVSSARILKLNKRDNTIVN
jgi:predicted Fe-S protein YdhL (DUF1289 family)